MRAALGGGGMFSHALENVLRVSAMALSVTGVSLLCVCLIVYHIFVVPHPKLSYNVMNF